MYANQLPQNHENEPESSPDGSVWAQTLSKRRPEAQDHFPSPPGSKNPIKSTKNTENYEIPKTQLKENYEIPIFTVKTWLGASQARG